VQFVQNKGISTSVTMSSSNCQKIGSLWAAQWQTYEG